jgi:hypothetical protein
LQAQLESFAEFALSERQGMHPTISEVGCGEEPPLEDLDSLYRSGMTLDSHHQSTIISMEGTKLTCVLLEVEFGIFRQGRHRRWARGAATGRHDGLQLSSHDTNIEICTAINKHGL